MTLTEFLLARIAEDEADARAAINPKRPGTHWQWETIERDRVVNVPTWEDTPVSLRTAEEFPTTSGVGPLPAFVINHSEIDEPFALPHIARWDPARVLAECEAKRRIVATRPVEVLSENPQAWQLHGHVLRLLSLPYADHPDYREEWRP